MEERLIHLNVPLGLFVRFGGLRPYILRQHVGWISEA